MIKSAYGAQLEKVPLRSLKRSSGAGALLLPGDDTLLLASAVSDEDLPHN